MTSRQRLVAGLLFAPALAILLFACGSGSLVPSATPPPTSPLAPTSTPQAPPTAVSGASDASPTAQPAASPTQPPPSPTPAGSLQFDPSQIPQGGVAVVYLYEAAASATVPFGGRQYPMLRDGNRWWAIIGVGALANTGLAPVSVAYTPAGGGEARTVVQSITITDREFPVEHVQLSPETASLLAPEIVQAEFAKRAAIFSGYTMQRMWTGPFQPPSSGMLTDHYGVGRSYNNGPVTDYHRGTDFAGEIGAPVYAAATGRVVFTGELKVRGNTVIIDHGAGVFTAYHHLSAINVQEGEAVTAGRRIGAIGSTGLVTGPHLHWEVVVRGVEVDGEAWLKGVKIGP